jgi:hypothetical protein
MKIVDEIFPGVSFLTFSMKLSRDIFGLKNGSLVGFEDFRLVTRLSNVD